MDYTQVITALAAKYDPSAITPPPGQPQIRIATALAPNNIPATPFLLVEPDKGTFVNNPGRRMGQHDFFVRLYLSKSVGDQKRELTSIYAWLTVLFDALNTGSKLGLAPLVMKALMTNYLVAVFNYAGDEYDGIELNVSVWTEEAVQITP